MYSDSKKIQLIEEVLRVNNSSVLKEIEQVLKKSQRPKNQIRKKKSLQDIVGLISKKDGALMKKAIEKGCEQVHPDDWK